MDASKEVIEQVLQTFAEQVCERYGIQFRNGTYKVEVEEVMLPDFVMFAGNPVVIKIHFRVFAEGLLRRNMIIVKHTLRRALEIASKRMLHTLSQNPTAPVLSKNILDKTWTKHQSSDKLLPSLLPLERLTFSTKLVVTVVDKESGEYWVESGYAHRVRVEELERRAHANLSKFVLNNQEENETQENPEQSIQLHPPQT